MRSCALRSTLTTRILTLALLLITSAAALAQPHPRYEIYAIRYATIPGFPVSELVAGADPARKIDIAMTIWLVRGNGRNILVDSGFYHDRFFKDWQVKDFAKPSETLRRVGLKPEDITDVIISHMHWDHVDGIDLFPNARIWIQ
jgi:glyoxylase-like metal-dependent hydrolase (beta-lactamase superfamily II)